MTRITGRALPSRSERNFTIPMNQTVLILINILTSKKKTIFTKILESGQLVQASPSGSIKPVNLLLKLARTI